VHFSYTFQPKCSIIEPRACEVLRNQSLTISAKPDGAGAASQRLIPTGEQSSLLTRIAVTNAVRCACGRKADGVCGSGIGDWHWRRIGLTDWRDFCVAQSEAAGIVERFIGIGEDPEKFEAFVDAAERKNRARAELLARAPKVEL
jgi:hypothetical protein